ncbi:TIGR02270 family protein [Variovorax sp. 375MFSha3.1]|uniref:TIGR02270 family protein n=1 Tax=unclassified Variovorax TaxID=663243 RepID=UPI003AAAD7CB
MHMPSATPIPVVVQQHADESAVLAQIRLSLSSAPHVRLHHLRRLDERLAAHLDGLVVAGGHGVRCVEAALAEPGVGAVFATTWLAIAHSATDVLARLFALAEAEPSVQPGVAGAFGWTSGASLRGLVAQLQASPRTFARRIGIAACEAHGVDPGEALAVAIACGEDAALRAQGLGAAGRCARTDLLGECLAALGDPDDRCRFQAARTALWLGDRHAAVEALGGIACMPGPDLDAAVAALFKWIEPGQAAPVLKALLDSPDTLRQAMRAAGVLGDPQAVPWLIRQMDDPVLSRLAGESFSLITGADLAALDLERAPVAGTFAGADDEAAHEDVEMDEDEGLPWPDPERVQRWWSRNAEGFVPGARYFMGAPPSWTHCVQVLRSGFQRQRIAAAEYLCLLHPGTRLFPTGAPAWRQRRWLDHLAPA